MFECKAFINPTMKCDYKLLFEDSKIETQKFNIDLSQIVLLENLPARMQYLSINVIPVFGSHD